VFQPGDLIEPLVASLLGQTMPAGDRELVFVDDGSRDGTGERLDALAALHADVRVLHIPNSGWPGRPRNVGLDVAQGEFVFFADHDDWLELDALERMYAATREHGADIVIGKVVGHGGRRTPDLGAADRHGLTAADVPLALLTPHKLFRRALLDEHGIRFPEGEQRLEDHLFVVPALFAAERISLLVSRPVYHWVLRPDRANASRRRPAPDAHSEAIRELLAIVDARTEPGPVRDRYDLHWYRVKVLRRLGGPPGDREYGAQLLAASRALIGERFPPRLDDALSFNLRLRARLARRGDAAGLERLAAFNARLRARVRIDVARRSSGGLELELTGRLRCGGEPAVVVACEGERLRWEPPPELAAAFGDEDRDITGALGGALGIRLRSQADDTVWPLTVTSTLNVPAAADGEPVRPSVTGSTRIDPRTVAGGGPLPPGVYDVPVTLWIAGFGAETTAQVEKTPFTIGVSPGGRIASSARVGAERSPRARIGRALRRLGVFSGV
jgi:glycosyltransferase involved in cell wall biosynthesis